jgi:hypothetical protein
MITRISNVSFLTFICAFLIVIGCANDVEQERVYNTSHFRFLYTVLDEKNITQIADSLEAAYPRITSDLQSGELPLVTVHFYENQEGLKKIFPDIPVWAIGQAISVSEIHMVSPNNPKQDYQTMIRNVKHEFAHCVSLKINPTIANNPRWLWESVALYEGNLPWDSHMLPYLANHQPPTLEELNDINNPKIYQVGYFISQYIVETFGAGKLRSLIENNGDLKRSLNKNEKEFTEQWFAFVKNKYGIKEKPM